MSTTNKDRIDEFTGTLITEHGFSVQRFAYQAVLEREAVGSEPRITVVVDRRARGEYQLTVRMTAVEVTAHGSPDRCLPALAERCERRARALLEGAGARPHIASSLHVIGELAAQVAGVRQAQDAGGAACAH